MLFAEREELVLRLLSAGIGVIVQVSQQEGMAVAARQISREQVFRRRLHARVCRST